MTKQVKVGDKIRIVDNSSVAKYSDGVGHYFAVGSVVTVKALKPDGTAEYAEGIIADDGHSRSGQIDSQFIREDHYELIAPKIDFTKPVQTKGGESVEIITTNGRGTYPVIGFVGGNESPSTFTSEGVYYIREASITDLENVPEKPVEIAKYFNVYNDLVMMHDTRAEADDGAEEDRIACKRVVFTAGEFDA
jgi:hypothetical protein